MFEKLNVQEKTCAEIECFLNEIDSSTFVYPANFSTNFGLDKETANKVLLLLTANKFLDHYTVPVWQDEEFFEEKATLGFSVDENIELTNRLFEIIGADDLEFVSAYRKKNVG